MTEKEFRELELMDLICAGQERRSMLIVQSPGPDASRELCNLEVKTWDGRMVKFSINDANYLTLKRRWTKEDEEIKYIERL